MTKKILHKIWDAISYILAIIVVGGGTLFAYYYANGYRFNPINGEVKQTGVLNVEGVPTKADIYVNNENIGKSPKVYSIEIGDVNVKVTKEGYRDWEKVVPIQAEKSTTLTPTLILNNPQAESIFSSKGSVIQQYSDEKTGKLYVLTLSDSTYKLFMFDPNKRFWNFSDNPTIIYTLSSKGVKNIGYNISPDGNWAFFTKTLEDKTKEYSFVKLSIPHQILEKDELVEFANEYTINWANDSNYMILESKADLIAYRFSDSTKYLLLKKNAKLKYIWTTDSDGFFYYTTVEKTESGSKVSILQTTLQGTNKRTILKDIYFQTSDSAITKLREENLLTFDSLINTKENQNFSGDLTSFNVIPGGQGIFLSTTKATYWYNLEEILFILIHPKQSEFISTSPDNNKILFFDESTKSYGIFTHNKIEADPLTQLGTKIILDNTVLDNIKWLNNSTDLIFKSENKVFKIEYDGYNKQELIEYQGAYNFNNDLQYFYTFSPTKEKDSIEIIKYKMY